MRVRKRSALARAAGLALWAALVASAAAALEVPPLAGRVNDRAGLLSHEEAAGLERRLAAFEQESGHQLVLLTVPSLEGEDIETFSIRLAERWKIGHAGLDNGVILVIAAKDRRARIEVGYGLEGVIPDAVAARILREQVFPHFRTGAMSQGILAGFDALMAAARGENVPLPARQPRAKRRATDSRLSLALFIGLLAGGLGAAFRRKRPGLAGVVASGLAGAVAYGFTRWLPALAMAAGVALAMAVGGGRGARGYRGGWGGGFRGGGFGGGFGGGGFSGGGGGFGGGGASGSW